MVRTFRAAVLFETGKPLRLVELPVPEPQPGQVLVRVAFSGVCRSQLMEARGHRGPDRYLPHLLGHEGAGTVVAAGAGVTKVREGDDVILGWIKGQGMDVPGPTYEWNGTTVSAGAVTTFSDHTIVSENRCVKMPAGLPMDVAVLFGCALPTGAGIILNHVKPARDSTLAVFGLGGIGLSALLASRLCECRCRIAVDVEEGRLNMASGLGATHVVNAATRDAVATIAGITDGQGVDVSVEASGVVGSIEAAFRSVRKFGGLCVFASHPPHGSRMSLDPFDFISGKRLEGSWGGSSRPDEDIPRLAGAYFDGLLPLEKLLSRPYRLEEINTALEDLERRKIVRAIIDMNRL